MTTVILLTGAAGGIGQATLHALEQRGQATHGWDSAWTPSEGKTGEAVDVTDAGTVHEAWSILTAEHRVGGVVNAAGIWRRGQLADMPEDEWRHVLEVNLVATMRLCQLAIPHLIQHGGGSIVNVASLAAIRPPRVPSAAYAAAKAGIAGLTAALGAEVADRGVRVNCISPGAIKTEMLTSNLSPEEIRSYGSASAAGRLGKPAEVARVIAFLLSDESSYVNGANIPISGG